MQCAEHIGTRASSTPSQKTPRDISDYAGQAIQIELVAAAYNQVEGYDTRRIEDRRLIVSKNAAKYRIKLITAFICFI
jgi:hypothetical protein